MPPAPSVSAQEVGGLVFDADFDSGNCARVEQRGEFEFALWTRADAEGTQDPLSKPRPVWATRAARAAEWPRLAKAWGSPRHALALQAASGAPAGR